MSAEVYVAGALRQTDREWWGIYERIGNLAEQLGLNAHIPHIHTVTAAGSTPEAIHNHDLDNIDAETRIQVYETNRAAVMDAKFIIAEVTNPSLGTGMEVGWAIEWGKQIICLVRRGTNLSTMIVGPARKGQIDLIVYETEQDAFEQLKSLLAEKILALKS